ncbi:endonuclease domain-containing protein [Saccharopolyspora taberi]|uniref:endonuclease domain-containing protein n=1 Tax=Saccharopolyspora taberi TaxID=60895 RepID=UPI003CD06CD9
MPSLAVAPSGGGLLGLARGRCALCGVPGCGMRLIFDHCHRSGLTRGLLCSSCNTWEGVGQAAVLDAYRLRPPAVLFGHSEPYLPHIGSPPEPQDWVVQRLGPRPETPRAAAEYLRRAAELISPATSVDPARWSAMRRLNL